MNRQNHPRFHLAFPVTDLDEAKLFYRDLLGCETGRQSGEWIDFNFWGHQVVAHLSPEDAGRSSTGVVDGHPVPVNHFGVILEWEEWLDLADRLESENLEFIVDPGIRFQGEPGEQATMIFKDPSGNALEFKAFRNEEQIFAV